ncbi:uncharacterized protein Dvir_GJ26622 [Drosophila virilis]|uniref:Uncharacterized protein n=1 Tax=Drosophila virilis TaxID=7244 RepID=A0A0Q9W6C9_DROVI|nr:uncharacterized protein Dvir_GJ26622 [Drosophila virilis]
MLHSSVGVLLIKGELRKYLHRMENIDSFFHAVAVTNCHHVPTAGLVLTVPPVLGTTYSVGVGSINMPHAENQTPGLVTKSETIVNECRLVFYIVFA